MPRHIQSVAALAGEIRAALAERCPHLDDDVLAAFAVQVALAELRASRRSPWPRTVRELDELGRRAALN